MYPDHLPLRGDLRAAHQASWAMIGQPGAFWTGAERVALVAAARAAHACQLCAERKDALSPFAVSGKHDNPDTPLPEVVVDFVHRLATDPGRFSRRVFDEVIAGGVSRQQYVEAVGVVNSSVIIDTLHASLGLELPALPEAQPGQPTGEYNRDAVDGGAWVPIMAGDDTLAATGLPNAPNIARSMGLVPSVVGLFFQTFRPHYALADIPLDITQAQAEFVASRVSSLNQCFY